MKPKGLHSPQLSNHEIVLRHLYVCLVLLLAIQACTESKTWSVCTAIKAGHFVALWGLLMGLRTEVGLQPCASSFDICVLTLQLAVTVSNTTNTAT